MWNGLLVGLRNARKGQLRAGDAETRARLEAAGPLLRVLALIDEVAEPETADAIGSLAAFLRIPVDRRARLGLALALPISLRNRVAHDAPDDPAWWLAAATALARSWHSMPQADSTSSPTTRRICRHPGFSPRRAARSGRSTALKGKRPLRCFQGRRVEAIPGRFAEVLLGFQRLLGKADSQVQDVRRLLARLGPRRSGGSCWATTWSAGRSAQGASRPSIWAGN